MNTMNRRSGGVRSGRLGLGTLAVGWLALAAGALVVASCETVSDSVTSVSDTVGDAMTPAPAGKREVDAYAREPELRVRVQKDAHDAEVSGPELFVVRPVAGTRKAGLSKPVGMKGPLKVSSGDRGVTVVDGAGATKDFGFGVDVEVLASDGTPDGAAESPSESVRLGGTPYPGFLTVRPGWNDDAKTFDVCVSMPVESYLPGVLSKELFKDWPRQAFEAQAVAARTYALQERQRARAEGRASDVEDSTADQVFGGTSNLTVAVEAVRATRGQVLTYNGKLIRAYFSSQCGGQPASAAQAWPAVKGQDFNKAEPLQAHKRAIYCQRSPLYRWSVTRKTDDVTARLRTWGRGRNHDLANLGRLRGIEVKDRNETGRPNRYTVSDSAGREYVVTAEELRQACNTTVPGQPPITKENRLSSGDVEVTVFADEVRFAGRGFGHGVGMCQWCAKGMADTGMDWRSMVEQFYQGAEVKKLY